MEIPAEFFNVSFNKAMAFGYRTDDVDEFVTSALKLTKRLQEENEALQQKLEVLAASLEGYRDEEDSLRSALIGAQKLGDSILKDSRHKAEIIIQEATQQAEQLVRDGEEQCDRQRYELEKLQAETTDFKEHLFAIYRTHLDIVKNIPSGYDKAERPAIGSATQQFAQSQPQSEQPEDVQPPFEQGRTEAEVVQQPLEPQEDFHLDDSGNQQENPSQAIDEAPFVSGFDAGYEGDYEADDSAASGPPEQPQASPYPDSDSEPPPYEEPYAAKESHSESSSEPLRHRDRGGFSGRNEATSQFSVSPKVQLEFENDDFDEDDDFAAEKLLLREMNQKRIPYPEDDEDDFAAPITGKKKLVISEKFGELKFGDSFNLRDD